MAVDTSKSGWVKWSKELKKKKLTETLELTYNLFKEGYRIKQIAKMRGFKNPESIEKHIHELITKSFLSVDDVIRPRKKEAILQAFEEYGIKSIKPIKESLGNKYNYFEIKCVLAHLSAKPDKLKKKK